MTPDEFIEKMCQRHLPQNQMARVRTLAKEMAEGVLEGVWGNSVYGDEFAAYLSKRWKSNAPPLHILAANGYIEHEMSPAPIAAAYALVELTEPSTIFISYKRSESSAFALLVLARLKQGGLEPFLDLALEPGEDWQAGLKNRIQSRDYFVWILGPTSLQSEVVNKEIQWALEGGLAIIPIWHGGFKYNPAEWNLSPEIDRALQHTHTIRVIEESALAYNNAIVELLNRFGITP
jgi:hypothetical protein